MRFRELGCFFVDLICLIHVACSYEHGNDSAVSIWLIS